MKGIVVHCPRCSQHIDLGYESKFEIFNCPHCAYKFRGIYADNVGKFGGNLARIWRDGFYDILSMSTLFLLPTSCQRRGSAQILATLTPCPFCRRAISPESQTCPYCTKNLPWYPAGEWRQLSCPSCSGSVRAFDWAAGSMPDEYSVPQCGSRSCTLGSADLPAEFRCGNCNAVNCADLSVDPDARCNWCKESFR